MADSKKEKYVRLNISLPETLTDRAKHYCEIQPVPIPFSGLIRVSLEKYLEAQGFDVYEVEDDD